jgi:phosphate transport system permease protein
VTPGSPPTEHVSLDVATGLRATPDEPVVGGAHVVAGEPGLEAQRAAGAGAEAQGVHLVAVGHGPDRAFRGTAYAAAFLVVALVSFVGIFLVVLAGPRPRREPRQLPHLHPVGGGWRRAGVRHRGAVVDDGSHVDPGDAHGRPGGRRGGAADITQYLRPKGQQHGGLLIDLLAAVPSIIYGLWGVKVGPALAGVYDWLSATLGWIPFFAPGIQSTGNVMTASVVLAIMILPIVSAMSRTSSRRPP